MSKLQQAVGERRSSKSFVDLRKFGSNKSAGLASTGSTIENRFLSCRRLLDWPPGSVSAGVIALDAGCGVVPPQPVDEFITVAKSAIALTQSEHEFTLGPAGSAVLGHGAEFALIQHAPRLEPSGTPSAELLLAPPRPAAISPTTTLQMANSPAVPGIQHPTAVARCFIAIAS